ncbi:hypothetical protein PO903_18590 [Paenibacillus sp. PK4536]|uniref:ABC-three component system middle component 1 n=1 Tax=Paenibacillus sp. PK4536 TaxID=3024576 RepID=UPI002359682B|nr:ABC-three component system middle component 1 [Paenibacillus sp. PK4536]WIM38638.1 hypothetical protein PO903_18590 [Paenibacillus sp. PK4536]
MRMKNIREKLEFKNFYNNVKILESLDKHTQDSMYQNNLELWFTEERVVFIKEYTSDDYFKKNWRSDQIIISDFLALCEPKYKNNLYFLLVLNWVSELSTDTLLEVNEIEKNSRVCRKYVLYAQSDLLRISFLQEEYIKVISKENFADKLKNRLLSSNKENNPIVEQLLNSFFEINNIYNKNNSKDIILNILKENNIDEN